MGLRHRSIRLRVGILIALPVLCLVILYGFAASITLGNALTQTRATSVRKDLVDPVSAFQQQVALERGLAMLSLATPTDQQVETDLGLQEAATNKARATVLTALESPSVTSDASGAERSAFRAMARRTGELNTIRGAVAAHAISMRTALADYNSIIDSGNAVLDTASDALANVAIVTQSLDLLNLAKADQAAVAETDMLAGDIAQRRFPTADRVTIASLAGSRVQLVDDSLPAASGAFPSAFAKYLAARVSDAMLTAESTVTDTPWRAGAAPASVLAARASFAAYSVALGKALTAAAVKLQQNIERQAHTVLLQLVLAVGLGLLASITSITLSLVLGRGLVRQLRELRESALSLAQIELPGTITQLRAGQSVDLDDHGPAKVTTANEIEQVQDAFRVVKKAALQSAVDEAQLRRGISDVFRNLAGRSRSLLQRQLTLLDAMERRATEPEQLEDLFRIDHLTTRMRRHAEGLIILSGDTPARGWRQPVPLIDVMRAAVAEVEDYTRIRVVCRTRSAVAGHAVADVIHLLAELAENATVFSPPNTPVRMQGDVLGPGLAIEIEDRGLGISQARLGEINANLASPPQFDLSGSDRLGLFIAGRLAQRHEIKVSLRPSVYGGTTALVLLPTALVVDHSLVDGDRALPAGLGDRPRSEPERIGGRHAALAAVPASNGDSAAAASGQPNPAAESDRGLRTAGFTFERLTQPTGSTDDPGAGATQPAPAAAPLSRDGNTVGSPEAGELAELGLPVRVRQASLAPQLRNTALAGAAESAPGQGDVGLPRRRQPASGPVLPRRANSTGIDATDTSASPEAARNTVAALQRGWQRGRAAQPDVAEPAPDVAAEAGRDGED